MISQVFEWLSPAVTQHVALALLQFLWQGALVAVAVAVMLRLVRDDLTSDDEASSGHSTASSSSRANLRYMIACFGLLLMAVLPVVNLLVVQPNVDAIDGFGRVAAVGYGTRDGSMRAAVRPNADSGLGMSLDIPAPLEGEAAETWGVTGLAGPVVDEEVGSVMASRTVQYALQSFFWIWVVGVAVLSVWHVAGWIMSQRFRRQGVAVAPETQAVVQRIAQRLGIRQVIAVRQAMNAAVPVVIGWVKPVLVLPASILTGLSQAELEAVLAHELAHIRRHDYLVNLMQAVIETVLFYHPAVWWLSRRIRNEREFCADDLAMRVCEGREVYAQSLVVLAEMVRTPPAHAVAATGGRLLVRIRRVMLLPDGQAASRHAVRRTLLIAVAAVVCLGGVMAVAQNRTGRAQSVKGVSSDGGTERAVDSGVQEEQSAIQDAESEETVVQATPDIDGEEANSGDRNRRRSTEPRSWKQINAALKENSTVEWREERLQNVLNYYSMFHGIHFVLDRRALDAAQISANSTASLNADGISVAEVLDGITSDLKLTWCVTDNVVLITTPREAWNLFDLRVYRDTAPRMMGAGSRVARDIVHQIQPESWSDVGGPGSVTPISGLEAIQESLLVVRQTHEVHRQIEERCANELHVVPPAWDALPPGLADTHVGEELNRPSSLEVIEMPFEDVLAHLAKKHEVAITLDQQALADVGMPGNIPITRKLMNLPLRSILTLVLRDLDLVWSADKDEIRITTKKVAGARLVRFQYPVDDLKIGRRTWPLIPMIESTIGSNWAHYGGPATIQQEGDKLDIQQTFENHLRISSLLETLRRLKREAPRRREVEGG